MRPNYQAGIWRCSLQQHPLVPSPVKRGWVRNDDGQLTVEWMRGSPAPDAVLQLLLCNCSRRCKLPECQCMSNGLKCTNLCKLQTCDNQPPIGGAWHDDYWDRPDRLWNRWLKWSNRLRKRPSHTTYWSFVLHVLCDCDLKIGSFKLFVYILVVCLPEKGDHGDTPEWL